MGEEVLSYKLNESFSERFRRKAGDLVRALTLSTFLVLAEPGLEGLVSSSQIYAQSNKGPEITNIFRNPKTPFKRSMIEAQKIYDSTKDKTEKKQIYWNRAWFRAYDELIDYWLKFDKGNPGLSYGREALDSLDITDTVQVRKFENRVVPVAFAKLNTDSTEFTARTDIDLLGDCYSNTQGDNLANRICWAEMVGCWNKHVGTWDDCGKFVIRRGVPRSYELPVMRDSLILEYNDGSKFICKEGKNGWTFVNSDRNTLFNYADAEGKFFSMSEFDTLKGILISSAGPFPARYFHDSSLSVLDLFGKMGDLWTETKDSTGKKHRNIDLDIGVNVLGFSDKSGRDTGFVLLYNYAGQIKSDVSGNNKKDVFYLGLDVGPFFSKDYFHFKQEVKITNHGETEQKKSMIFQWDSPPGIPIYSMIAGRDTNIILNKDTTILHTKRKSGIPPLGSTIVEGGDSLRVGFPLIYSGPQRDSTLEDTVRIYLTPFEEKNPRAIAGKGKFKDLVPMYYSIPKKYLETAISSGAKIDTFNVTGTDSFKYDITASEWGKLSKKLNERNKAGDNVKFEVEVDTTILPFLTIESPPDKRVYNKVNPSWVFPVKMNGERYKWFNSTLSIPNDLDMRGYWNVVASYIATTNSKEKLIKPDNGASMMIKIE